MRQPASGRQCPDIGIDYGIVSEKINILDPGFFGFHRGKIVAQARHKDGTQGGIADHGMREGIGDPDIEIGITHVEEAREHLHALIQHLGELIERFSL